MEKIKGVLVSREANGALVMKAHELEKKDGSYLDALYSAIKCDTVDVVSRRIGQKWFDLWVDDNGLLVNDPVFTGLTVHSENGEGKIVERLAGNIFICGSDKATGELASLSDEEIAGIQKERIAAWDKRTNKPSDFLYARV